MGKAQRCGSAGAPIRVQRSRLDDRCFEARERAFAYALAVEVSENADVAADCGEPAKRRQQAVAIGGELVEVLVLGLEPEARPLVAPPHQGVQAAIDAHEQEGELAFLRRQDQPAAPSLEAVDARGADPEDHRQLLRRDLPVLGHPLESLGRGHALEMIRRIRPPLLGVAPVLT